MNKTQYILTVIFELMFPRDKNVIICDSVTRGMLEKLAVRVFVENFENCIAPLPYKHKLVKNMVHSAKYHNHSHASNVLGEVVAGFLSEELADRGMFGNFEEPVFVPIPLHTSRHRERGYNQAKRITASIVKTLNYEKFKTTNTLLRQKNTSTQSHLKNRRERFENMKNAFLVSKPEAVRGKDIVLVDDVTTTGATFIYAKRELLRAGAREVLCVAAAH